MLIVDNWQILMFCEIFVKIVVGAYATLALVSPYSPRTKAQNLCIFVPYLPFVS